VCWEGQHLHAILFVTLPAFFVWIVLPPVVFFWILKNDKSWKQPNDNITLIK
jgi:hypothetical protein